MHIVGTGRQTLLLKLIDEHPSSCTHALCFYYDIYGCYPTAPFKNATYLIPHALAEWVLIKYRDHCICSVPKEDCICRLFISHPVQCVFLTNICAKCSLIITGQQGEMFGATTDDTGDP